MTDPIADVDVDRDGTLVLVTLRGEIDLSNGGSLRARIAGECRAARVLVLDLCEVTYMDSAGLALLDGLAADLAVAAGRLLLVAPEGCAANRVVVLSGLGVPMHADRPSALAEARR